MPAPDAVAPRRNPKSLIESLLAGLRCHHPCVAASVAYTADVGRGLTSKTRTHPPRNAPTGFLTGATTPSCLNAALVWNARVATMGALVPVRAAAMRTSGNAIAAVAITKRPSQMSQDGRD